MTPDAVQGHTRVVLENRVHSQWLMEAGFVVVSRG